MCYDRSNYTKKIHETGLDYLSNFFYILLKPFKKFESILIKIECKNVNIYKNTKDYYDFLNK